VIMQAASDHRHPHHPHPTDSLPTSRHAPTALFLHDIPAAVTDAMVVALFSVGVDTWGSLGLGHLSWSRRRHGGRGLGRTHPSLTRSPAHSHTTATITTTNSRPAHLNPDTRPAAWVEAGGGGWR
jgi:hypothetical protein